MPVYAPPTSDQMRLRFLKQAVVKAANDAPEGKNYVAEETRNEITEFIPVFENTINRIIDSYGKWIVETQESKPALEHMKTCIRDMWEAAIRRAFRNNQSADVLTYYELPKNGLTPKPTTTEEWFIIAENMINGDAKAVKAGYPAMQNPNVKELKSALEKALSEKKEISFDNKNYKQVRAELEELRLLADELISDVMADLNYSLRKMGYATKRRIMRSYGANFQYLKDEPKEEYIEQYWQKK
jgi:hypothetical protein